MKYSAICVALAACLSLSGCWKTETSVCEAFIRKGLNSPSSYRRESISTSDSEPDKFGDGVRTMGIEYDAANAYGTLIRGKGWCEFTLHHGRVTDDLKFMQQLAEWSWDSYNTRIALGVKDPDPPKCCR